MRMVTLNPSMMLGTRTLLGAGIGLLAAGSLAATRHRPLSKAFLAVGAASTIRSIWAMARGVRRPAVTVTNRVEQDDRLRGATRFPRKGDDQM